MASAVCTSKCYIYDTTETTLISVKPFYDSFLNINMWIAFTLEASKRHISDSAQDDSCLQVASWEDLFLQGYAHGGDNIGADLELNESMRFSFFKWANIEIFRLTLWERVDKSNKVE